MIFSTSLREVKEILAAWAGFGSRVESFELAAPFSSAGHWRDSFGRRSRPLPSASAEMTLQEVVQLMLADGGYAGVDATHLALFAQSPSCPSCAGPSAGGASFGRTASCLKQFGGRCSFGDGGGHVIYQVGARAQCGNCWLLEAPSAAD